jgi:hypothetical protein
MVSSFFDGGVRGLDGLHPFQLWRCGGMNRGVHQEKTINNTRILERNHQQHLHIRTKVFRMGSLEGYYKLYSSTQPMPLWRLVRD